MFLCVSPLAIANLLNVWWMKFFNVVILFAAYVGIFSLYIGEYLMFCSKKMMKQPCKRATDFLVRMSMLLFFNCETTNVSFPKTCLLDVHPSLVSSPSGRITVIRLTIATTNLPDSVKLRPTENRIFNLLSLLPHVMSCPSFIWLMFLSGRVNPVRWKYVCMQKTQNKH